MNVFSRNSVSTAVDNTGLTALCQSDVEHVLRETYNTQNQIFDTILELSLSSTAYHWAEAWTLNAMPGMSVVGTDIPPYSLAAIQVQSLVHVQHRQEDRSPE